MTYVSKNVISSRRKRRGTTLSEILISLLVMSIGVVSLATLFPISVLRTVQATHLTNAANLRYNAEAAISIIPELYSVGPSWQPGVPYTLGTLVTPTTLTSLKAPAVVFKCTTAGTSGQFEPNWNYTNGSTTADGATAIWTTFTLNNYVVDPLGELLVESAYRNIPASGDFFGNDPTAGTVPQTLVRAFSGVSTLTDQTADAIATLPDSWVNQSVTSNVSYTSPNTTCNVYGVDSDITAYVANPQAYFNLPFRAVFYDETGKVSHSRPIYQIYAAPGSGWTIDWTQPVGTAPDFGPLPVGFTPAVVRLESKDRRYTWMLSVRRGLSGAAYMDVVVFFKRTFSGKDEQLYPCTFTSTMDFGTDLKAGVAGIDDDGNGFVDTLASGDPDPAEIGWPGSDDLQRMWAILQYDGSKPRPYVKKGGFVTDADNLRWYRIVDFVEGTTLSGFTPTNILTKAGYTISGLNPNPTPTPASPYASPYQVDGVAFGANTKAILLKLDAPISQTGPQNPGGVPTGRAMVMRGIVDVYPIRTHLSWEN